MLNYEYLAHWNKWYQKVLYFSRILVSYCLLLWQFFCFLWKPSNLILHKHYHIFYTFFPIVNASGWCRDFSGLFTLKLICPEYTVKTANDICDLLAFSETITGVIMLFSLKKSKNKTACCFECFVTQITAHWIALPSHLYGLTVFCFVFGHFSLWTATGKWVYFFFF